MRTTSIGFSLNGALFAFYEKIFAPQKHEI
jgi:hypothetical protein